MKQHIAGDYKCFEHRFGTDDRDQMVQHVRLEKCKNMKVSCAMGLDYMLDIISPISFMAPPNDDRLGIKLSNQRADIAYAKRQGFWKESI